MNKPVSPPITPESGWQPRTVATAKEDVARYSKFVGYMRIGLPAVAGFLLLLVLVLPQFMGDDERFRIGTTPLKNAAVEALSMVNARYFGTDKKGQPYSVTAKGVKENPDNDKLVELTGPQADITLTNGDWLSIEAAAGRYDRDSEVLDLQGDVSLFQDKGYELHADAMTVKLKDGVASSRTKVQSQGPFGELNAQGFDLYDKGERVVFLGPARLLLAQGFKTDFSSTPAQTITPKTKTPSKP